MAPPKKWGESTSHDATTLRGGRSCLVLRQSEANLTTEDEDDETSSEETSSGEESVEIQTVPIRKKFDDEEDADDVSQHTGKRRQRLT